MREVRAKLNVVLQELEIKAKNCSKEIKLGPEGRLYLGKSHGKDCYYHATEAENGGFARSCRKAIEADGDLIKALAHKRFMEEMQKYLQRDIAILRSTLERMGNEDPAALMKVLPRAYRNLPPEYYLTGASGSGPGRTGQIGTCPGQTAAMGGRWTTTDSGIVIPQSLITAAKQGTLTSKQKEEIREIQREWAAQDYEVNTKNLEHRNKMTSRGLMVRSLSEVSIIERIYLREVPFRYDEVIHIGNKEASPDFSFLSITRGVIWWEHAGMTDIDSYVSYHRYKRKLYEQAGLDPWYNYIETYNEEDGFLDLRMIDAIIDNTLLRWLHLD